jgi:hypothetical protein
MSARCRQVSYTGDKENFPSLGEKIEIHGSSDASNGTLQLSAR